jgi:hypothetical protein
MLRHVLEKKLWLIQMQIHYISLVRNKINAVYSQKIIKINVM